MLAVCYFLLVARYFLLVARYFLVVTCWVLLAACYFLLVARYFLLVIRYSLHVTFCPAFMGNYLTINHTCYPYLASRPVPYILIPGFTQGNEDVG